jgi:hypothetical protein
MVGTQLASLAQFLGRRIAYIWLPLVRCRVYVAAMPGTYGIARTLLPASG